MSDTQDLLVEIGTEELPPKALEKLSEAFSSGICRGLEQANLPYTISQPFATPRRLAVHVKGVAVAQADQVIEKRGPALSAAYDGEGNPTKAALGFARSCGVDVDQLERMETDKGTWLVFRSTQSGQSTESLLTDIIESALAALPIPKRMRWSNLDYEFVRPIHWVVILFGHHAVETKILGVRSGRMTRGHRFHHPAPIELTSPEDYVKTLETKGHVIPVFATRREKVRVLIEQAAEDIGGTAIISELLLNEVTSLVEWPTGVMGSFDEKFLDVPAEALIAVMKDHQKYFHVVNAKNQLIPKFITISNIESQQPEVVKAGNERVLKPRFSDAEFFWQQDRARSLESRLDQLKAVVFQNKLGSLYDKSKRVATVAGRIATELGHNELQGIRAAQLSKCDLLTDMVGEFPELQGIMGEYYARHDGETDDVAIAQREQYMPRFWGDGLPETPLGQAVSIADKLDTLVGIFGIGQLPTGDKDPFGLRRAAIGVLRTMIECNLSLDLQQLLHLAKEMYSEGVLTQTDADTHVFDFILERMKSYYQDKGIRYDSVEAVLVCRPNSPLDADKRIHSVETFRQLSEAESLASANKRIHNILKKTEETYPEQPDPTHFNQAEERQLYDQVQNLQQTMTPMLENKDYASALQQLATLREAVDNFFDHVMVMDEDNTIRTNRLAFLQMIRHLFLQVADISKLQGSDG